MRSIPTALYRGKRIGTTAREALVGSLGPSAPKLRSEQNRIGQPSPQISIGGMKWRFGPSLCAYDVSGGNQAGFFVVETRFSTQEIWDLAGTVWVPGSYLTGAVSALRSSLISGFTEKNLCRHGSHRNAGIRSARQNIAIIPGTCSAAIRCNSKLPQFLQCA